MIKMGCILRYVVLFFLLIGKVLHAETTPATCVQNCPVPFVNNVFWTTQYGPAAANIVLSPTNFLSCSSSSYALCYYSGPDAAPTGKLGKSLPSLPCKVSKNNPNTAECRCYAESGASYVDIHSIRNTEAYVETVRVCGLNGEKCTNMASEAAGKLATQLGKTPPTLATAPVCSYLQAGANGVVSMAPKTELVSTFSFAQAKNYGTEQTSCTSSSMPYAGCMTASCTFERDKNGKQTKFANCSCPIYSGPYQVGQAGASCNAGSGNVWSAAYAPPSNE
ncbi:MAG: hypothetical protein V4525_10425 [Pseudomonadota bacterium]